jgi:hypothetical protein
MRVALSDMDAKAAPACNIAVAVKMAESVFLIVEAAIAFSYRSKTKPWQALMKPAKAH